MRSESKHRSRDLVDGPSRAPARAMLKAVGFTDDDLARPLVGVANTWIEVMPCNYHLRRLSEKVKAGIRAAGGTPIEYNTIAVADGISMGTEGMKASLISREVIADSIELVARGHLFDAVVALSGCDKTIPGTVMALTRLNLPSLTLYGGAIMPGRFQGHDVTIQDVFEAVGKHGTGKMTDAELKDLEDHACPGAGACGGQFTANTMSIAFEFLGIAPMGRNGVPALDPRTDDIAFGCGEWHNACGQAIARSEAAPCRSAYCNRPTHRRGSRAGDRNHRPTGGTSSVQSDQAHRRAGHLKG